MAVNDPCCTTGHWEDTSQIPWYDQADGIHVTDPIQGVYENCSLFAALSACAWAQADPYKGLLIPTRIVNTSKYVFKFYYPQAKSFTVTSTRVCFDAQNRYIGGKSKNPEGEIWPAIWEKAYAAYRYYILTGQYVSLVDEFDFCSRVRTASDWGGNAFYVLLSLTGSNTTLGPKPIKQKQPNGTWIDLLSPEDIIEDINDRSENGKIKSPNKMVAWTYLNSASIPNNYSPPPTKPYSYGTTISRNHAYAILGSVTYSGTIYIVLRDAVEACTPLPDTPRDWCGFENILNGMNGIFAVSLKEFHTVFEAYGAVA